MAQDTGEDLDAEVLAAGAVLWRTRQDGAVEVALVHRPKYDDWSLPKGKLDPGEDFAEAAVREVAEETGFTGPLGDPLGEVRYTDRKGRRKLVRWWEMRAREGAFTAHEEVDQLRWLLVAEALVALTYDSDRDTLTRFAAL